MPSLNGKPLGLFTFKGASMATLVVNAELSDIDEALMHASLIPEPERGPAWYAFTNALLEQRRTLEMK
jgi:hypothetical protein